MLSTANEGVQNLIDTVSKVIGGKPEGETSKCRRPFHKRNVHDGEASGIVRSKKAFVGASHTGKGANSSVLQRSRRISVGLEHADLAARHAEFKRRPMLYLVSYDSKFQITRNGKAPISSQALRILFLNKQSIRQGPDRPAEQSNALPFRGCKKTRGHGPFAFGQTGQKLGELGFDKLNVTNTELTKDIPRQLNIAAGHGSCIVHVVERRLDKISERQKHWT